MTTIRKNASTVLGMGISMPVELHINTALSSRDLLGEIDSVKTNDEVRVALDIQGARSPYSRAVFECADGRIVFDAQGVRLEPKR